MSFLFPAFLAGALAVAIPILLHFVRRESAPPLAFSDLRFLRRAQSAATRRRWLRDWLLLALRVAALLLLAAAFARPFFDASGLAGRSVTVVALDRSFSMAFPGMFERARAAARAAVAAAPAGDLVGVVTFDDRARVVAEPAPGRDAAVAAIGRAAAGYGATRYAAALDAAAGVIGAREGRIVVVTDLQQSGWAAGGGGLLPEGITVTAQDVEPAGGNLAVTVVEVTPAGAAAVVVNTGQESRTGRVELRAGGAVIEAEEMPLAPGANDIVFDAALPPAGLLEVAVEDPGGVAADDRRYHLLGAADRMEVALIGSAADAFYLDRALRAAPEPERVVVRSLEPAAVTAPALDGVGAVWLLGNAGLDRAGRGQLAALVAAGAGLLVVAGPGLDPALAADLLGPGAALAPATPPPGNALGWSVRDARHPVFRVFGADPGALGQVRFSRTQPVESTGGRVLAAFSDGMPALVEQVSGAGRLLLFASDLGNEWNDFPRRPAFVPFVHEVTRYLGARREQPRSRLVADAPPGVDPLPGAAVAPDSGRSIVLNVDPRESDPARMTAEAFQSRVGRRDGALAAGAARDDAATREAEQGWWWYAILAMAVLLVAESWLGRAVA